MELNRIVCTDWFTVASPSILMIRQKGLYIVGGNMAELLKIKDLSVSVEEKGILKNVNLSINKGETHVLMGPNGAGKSTLMNVIAGVLFPDSERSFWME